MLTVKFSSASFTITELILYKWHSMEADFHTFLLYSLGCYMATSDLGVRKEKLLPVQTSTQQSKGKPY